MAANKLDIEKNPVAYTIFHQKNDEGMNFVPEPTMAEDKISIWKK